MQNAPSNILRPNSPAPNGQDIRMKHFLTQFHFQELDFQNFLIFTYVSKKVISKYYYFKEIGTTIMILFGE